MTNQLDYIIMQNKVLIDMLSSLITAYAKDNNIAIESCEEECEYIDIERLDNES